MAGIRSVSNVTVKVMFVKGFVMLSSTAKLRLRRLNFLNTLSLLQCLTRSEKKYIYMHDGKEQIVRTIRR